MSFIGDFQVHSPRRFAAGRNRFAVLIFALLAAQVFGAGKATGAPQPVEELIVATTAAPNYPPIARAANVQEEVIVSVSVNTQGVVIAAQTLKGHTLLKRAAESAAFKWKFNPLSEKTGLRSADITFSFKLALEDAATAKTDVIFTPPARLEIIYKIPTIIPIDNAFWLTHEKNCPLHAERMRLGEANILYGLPVLSPGYPNDLAHIWQNLQNKIRRRFSYDEAARKHFPESKMWVLGGCIVGVEKKAETLYCKSCRNAELRWRKKHPGKGPSFAAVIYSERN